MAAIIKRVVDPRSAARAYTQMCIDQLAGIAQHGESETARVAAIAQILDRGWGRAATVVDPDGGDVVVTIRTITQRLGDKPMLTIEHDDDTDDEQR